MRVAIVGGGLGGLSAACHLAGRGHEVVVIERAASPGGRLSAMRSDGFHLDIGATVLTMRGILADTFAAAGSAIDDHLDLIAIDPMYRATFPGSGDVVVRRGREAMTDEIRTTCGARDADAFGRFCDWLQRLYQVEQPNFIDRNFDSPLDLARPIKPLIDLVRLGGLRRLHRVVASYFDDHRLQKLFSFQALYAGLSPFDALAIYAVITYMDTVEGVWFPRGGMSMVGEGLAAAATSAGASFVYGQTVERVLRRTGTEGPVIGVRLANGETIAADAIVANPDLPVAYRSLVPEVRPPSRASRGEYSPSCVLWVGGVKGSLPDGAAHHNIHFGGAWREAFAALLKEGRVMPDPSTLVTSHTVSDPTLAPPGGATLYCLEPVPNLDGQVDWSHERDRAKTRLLERVASHGYPVADSQVVVEKFIDPTDWEAMGMERGTPFGLSHRFFQSGPFRPSNIEHRVPGLYFVGSSTQPGVGVPMVLLSGRLVAERIGAA